MSTNVMSTSGSAETRIPGFCTCGRAVIKVLNSAVPTLWKDGTRYAYPETIDSDGWCVFRCQSCREPIDDTFRAASPGDKPEEQSHV